MTAGERAEMIGQHVLRVLEEAGGCAREFPVHPEQDRDLEQVSYQTYLLGETLAVWIEVVCKDAPEEKRVVCRDLVGALTKRLG